MDFRDDTTLRPKTVGRWQEPFAEAGGWVVRLKEPLTPREVSTGLRTELTGWTKEDLLRQMEAEDRKAARVAAMIPLHDHRNTY